MHFLFFWKILSGFSFFAVENWKESSCENKVFRIKCKKQKQVQHKNELFTNCSTKLKNHPYHIGYNVLQQSGFFKILQHNAFQKDEENIYAILSVLKLYLKNLMGISQAGIKTVSWNMHFQSNLQNIHVKHQAKLCNGLEMSVKSSQVLKALFKRIHSF